MALTIISSMLTQSEPILFPYSFYIAFVLVTGMVAMIALVAIILRSSDSRILRVFILAVILMILFFLAIIAGAGSSAGASPGAAITWVPGPPPLPYTPTPPVALWNIFLPAVTR